MNYRIFNVRKDVNASDCTRECTDTVKESALKCDPGRETSVKFETKLIVKMSVVPLCSHLQFLAIIKFQHYGHSCTVSFFFPFL